MTAPRQQPSPFRRPRSRGGCFLYAKRDNASVPVVGIPGEDRSANGRRHGSVENIVSCLAVSTAGKQHARRKETGAITAAASSQVSPAKHADMPKTQSSAASFGNSDGSALRAMQCEPSASMTGIRTSRGRIPALPQTAAPMPRETRCAAERIRRRMFAACQPAGAGGRSRWRANRQWRTAWPSLRGTRCAPHRARPLVPRSPPFPPPAPVSRSAANRAILSTRRLMLKNEAD